MSDLENNGLKKTPRGQAEQVKSNLDLTLSGKNIKQITISDCVVVNVKGVSSFGVFNYLPYDAGSLLVDVLLPKGKNLFSNGSPTRLAMNIRVRNSEEDLALRVGMLKEDFLFDENGKSRVGDLIIKDYNANSVSFNGEFVFKKPTKKYGTTNGYNRGKASLYGEKLSPLFGALHGSLDKSAVKKYKEMYLHELKKGDYYG